MTFLDRISRFLNSKSQKEINEYPRQLIIDDLTPSSVRFNVHNPVEHFRVADYGDEKYFLKLFLLNLKGDDVVFDIGASIGLFTVCAATFVRSGKIFAFEPDPENRERLLENIRLNLLENIVVVDWAVSDAEGEATLHTDGSAGYAPSFIKKQGSNAPQGQVKVKTSSLDLRLSNSDLPIPDVLKIDVEGAEGLCIKGTQKLLSHAFGRRPRLIFLELHPEFLSDFKTSAEIVTSSITDFGYKLLWSQTRNKQEHQCYGDDTLQEFVEPQ
jgi:FkbM family methyltransferase